MAYRLSFNSVKLKDKHSLESKRVSFIILYKTREFISEI